MGTDGPHLERILETPEETERLGARLGGLLARGDVVTLSGPLGAGKSALARGAIRARLGNPEAEVPSPTYTLINVYAAPDGEIWHADLYRLGDASEAVELGLEDAWEQAIVLIEWPERLGEALPPRRLDIALAPLGDGRAATLAPRGAGWERVLSGLSEAA